MSAGDVTARSVLELRESMIETTMDDRWCARSVCEDAIEALEASRAEVAALRRQVEELREIELSEECRGLLTAHGSDGTILVCGEFANGREFSQKFRARALRSGEAPAQRGEE